MTDQTTPEAPHLRRCSRCGKCFKSRNAADDHIRMKHHGMARRVSVKCPDYEPMHLYSRALAEKNSASPPPK